MCQGKEKVIIWKENASKQNEHTFPEAWIRWLEVDQNIWTGITIKSWTCHIYLHFQIRIIIIWNAEKTISTFIKKLFWGSRSYQIKNFKIDKA